MLKNRLRPKAKSTRMRYASLPRKSGLSAKDFVIFREKNDNCGSPGITYRIAKPKKNPNLVVLQYDMDVCSALSDPDSPTFLQGQVMDMLFGTYWCKDLTYFSKEEEDKQKMDCVIFDIKEPEEAKHVLVRVLWDENYSEITPSRFEGKSGRHPSYLPHQISRYS